MVTAVASLAAACMVAGCGGAAPPTGSSAPPLASSATVTAPKPTITLLGGDQSNASEGVVIYHTNASALTVTGSVAPSEPLTIVGSQATPASAGFGPASVLVHDGRFRLVMPVRHGENDFRIQSASGVVEVFAIDGEGASAPAAPKPEASANPPVALVPVSPDSKATLSRIAAGHASGDYAVAQTVGTVTSPTRIELRLSAIPAQSATVSWTMICQESGGGAGSKSGQSTRSLPTIEALPLPAPSDSCDVSANVQLSGSGTVRVALYG